MTAQLVEIAGQPMVLLTKSEFDRLSAAAINWSDIEKAVEAQNRRDSGEEYLPASVVDRIMSGESALKVWRTHRGLSQEELGQRVNRQGSMIAKLESGRAQGDILLWRALADALAADIDDIAPEA